MSYHLHRVLKFQCKAIVISYMNYDDHKYVIFVGLKMINSLLGQQGSNTKYSCILCLWNSHAKDFTQKTWPEKRTVQIGAENIIHEQLVTRGKIVFRTLHIKFGLVKQYINALDKEKDCFRCLCSSLAGLTEKKLKAGIFDGPQIRKMIRDEDFPTSVTNIEKRA